MQNRRSTFKKGVDAEEARRKRGDNIVEARKGRRDENLQKRRTVVPADVYAASSGTDRPAASRNLDDLQQYVALLMSDSEEGALKATTYFRKLLSIEKKPPIEEVVRQPGVVARFVHFLQQDANDKLQFEAAWALTNIASGTSVHTRVVIEHGAVDIFVRLLASPHEEVREQAVWALGNIAGDHPNTRDMVLAAGALPDLLVLLKPEANTTPSLMRNATWTLSNFCRGKPQPDFELTKTALPTLKRLITSTLDDEVLTDACWALSYLSDGPNDRIHAVIHAGVCRRLVELLNHDKASVLVPALRTVGNIVTGTDDQTQTVINCNALQALYLLLCNAANHKRSITKEACWTISNITAGTKAQIDSVIASGCVGPLVTLLGSSELDIKREAAWAISNATSGGDLEQVRHLVNYNAIPPLCGLLRCMDLRIVMVALEGLNNVLRAGETLKSLPGSDGANVYCEMLEEAGGLDTIETLQNHHSPEVAEKAVALLTGYFEVLDEENVVPEAGGSAVYDFPRDAPVAPAGAFNFSGV